MEQENLTPQLAYKIDEIVDFKVRKWYGRYTDLIDEKTGIISYLQGTDKLLLHKGQILKCRVLAVHERHPRIELVDIEDFEQSNNNLTEEKFSGLLDSKETLWNTKEFVKLILTDEKEQSFDAQCHRWIQSLLNKKIDLQTVRQDCLNILELSDFLNMCSDNERDIYQERLSLAIEQIGYYIKAAELIANDTDEDGKNETTVQFIDSIFKKLKLSGFIYHPSKNFNILASIFLLKPELMNRRMKDLLEIIRDKDDMPIWEREPFGSALIKLLELYIKECDGKIDKTKDNKDLIDSNLLALAIQLLLIKDTNNTSIADYRLNAARLCVLSSYLSPNSQKLVDIAYYNLFHSSAKLPPYNIKDVKMLPHLISNYTCGNIDTTNSFSQGNGQLLISENGIHLQTVCLKDTLRPVFPKELKLWKGLQVFLPSKIKTNLSEAKLNDITPYQSAWAEIEKEFFTFNKKPTAIADKNKKQHKIEDSVKISFTGQDVNDRNKYYCQIEDEIGGNGFIYVKDDIVCYSIPTTSMRHFMAADGSRFIFDAKIKDKEDDLFHFSMCDEIKDLFSDDYYSTDEDIICSIGNTPNYYGMSPAISQDGVSVSIKNAGEFEDINKHDIVRCRLIGSGPEQFHITCEMVDYAPDEEFDINTAFKRLMENSSVGRIPETISQEEQEFESDNLIDESYVREVIYMIDRMALLDTEYVKSYNYLGFARIMCLLIGWESQAAYYKGRMDIISMLHYFALNEKVDEEKLSQLENVNSELFSNNPLLKERFLQLQTISYMGKMSHNNELFNLSNENPSLKSLATLVLAYNITETNGLEKSATDIYNKIIKLLNLKGFETGLKLYGNGVETEEIEYKTSFIYNAEDNSSKPNIDKQKDEILKVVNSFLNTRGGTLYIGVNNYGYGVGVDDDLNYSLFYGDKEKYIRTISDAIALEMGNLAATYVKMKFDEDNTDKDVLIVEIQPIPSGISYQDSWYVRTAGSKRRLTKEEYGEYQKTRGLHVANHVESKDVLKDASELKPNLTNTSQQLIKSKESKIRTSRIRENVLYEWEEGFVHPIGYLSFLSDGKFKKIDNNYNDDDSILTIAVKENEQRGFLVLGYKNGCIVKIPVEELLEYKNRDYPRNTESTLIFASLANQGDAVLTISKGIKTPAKPLMRLDKLSSFKDGKLMEKGELPYNNGLISEALAFEIIPQKDINTFGKIQNLQKTTLGYSKNPETKKMVDILHSWGINEI